jgi:hypothetical protein
MSIVITFAAQADQRDALYAARYRVVVEGDRQYPVNEARRIADRFDILPATRNIIALDERLDENLDARRVASGASDEGEHGAVIGGVRFTEANPAGLPVDEWLDVATYLPATVGGYGSGGSFFLDRRYRRQTRVAGDMLTLAYAWALSRGWTHLIAALNPDILDTFLRYGYRQLSPVQHDPDKHLPYVPVLLDFATLDPALRDLCAQIPHAPTTSPSGNRFRWIEDAQIADEFGGTAR